MTTRRAALPKPKRKSAYHHEDLRRALLDAAAVHLRDGDVTTLTMQSLARAAGVSRGAPYHHFTDKVEVLAALAQEGFERWLVRAEKVVADVHEPSEALVGLTRSFLDFAVRYPSHYRVMFLPDIADRVRFASVHETSGRCLQLLVGVLAASMPRATHSDLLAHAVRVWSAIHGFAALRAAGVLENIPGLPSLAELEAVAIHGIVHG